ncbi:MAG: hypothetical protein WCE91_05790 [Nitrososphaeraceae archaeon]
MSRPRTEHIDYSQANFDSEHDLTLQEICPIWYSKLRNGLDEKDRSILSRDSKYCLVCRAWGFTGKQAGYYIAPLISIIGCWTCIKYGKRFGKISNDNDSNINNFEQLISEFLTHWNQKHKSVTAALKSRSIT